MIFPTEEPDMKLRLTKEWGEPAEEYFGFFFRRSTGMTYGPDGNATGFSFEDARQRLPDAAGQIAWQPISPLAFATEITAEIVLGALSIAVPDCEFTVAPTPFEGPFNRNVPERQIQVMRDGIRASATMSAGLLANQMMRQHDKRGYDMLRDQVASLFPQS